MIIKKVQLENYRSHSNITVEFTKGVNLILGKNGRGKTSILEAISTVMFNTKDRSGKETGKSYIKFGEKSSKVDIDFIANDGREYNLKTEFFKTKPKKQTLKDMTGSEYDGDIQEKLEELCGIKKGFEETYENIVIAKQNEFINIFKDSGTTREKTFNKIFNTQIYKEMYDSFLKEAVDRYKEEVKDLDKEITFLKENMEDKEQITNFLKEEEIIKNTLKTIPDNEKLTFIQVGNNALNVDPSNSSHTEAIEFAGGINKAPSKEKGAKSKTENLNMEEVMSWDPDVIFAKDKNSYDIITTSPAWSSFRAVKNGKVYLIPQTPYNWVTSPPSANKMMGIYWAAKTLYPKYFTYDLKEIETKFNKLIYGIGR